MTTFSWIRPAVALSFGVVLLGSLGPAAVGAEPAPVPMGDNTYSLTRKAGFAFLRNTKKLEKLARMDAMEFCAGMGRRMQEVSMTSKKASPITGGISEATLIFKALNPSDPEFASLPASIAGPAPAPVATARPERMAGPPPGAPEPELRGPEAARRQTEGISDADLLVELHRRGVLSDAEFEAARQRLQERAP